MATTVIAAFNEFLTHTVNLDPTVTQNARASLDWLFGQIHEFPNRSADFPRLYSEMDIAFGSFARRTKIRELDDVDLMVVLAADGASYMDYYGGRLEITVPDEHPTLRRYLHEGTNLLNSRRVINAFVAEAQSVPQYGKADIKRTQEAATLSLVSYDWTFDIVPAFFTRPEADGRTYYVIPNGDGHWKKTDPRIDRDRVVEVNQGRGGHVLNVLRAMKYWNVRKTAPAAPSYMFETIIVEHFAGPSATASEFVDLAIPGVLEHLVTAIQCPVNDPKNIQGDLNTLDHDDRLKIAQRAYRDAAIAREARRLEGLKDYCGSINEWRRVFGDSFPAYE